jgi:hypothetical protein
MTLSRPAALRQIRNRQPSDQTRRSQLWGSCQSRCGGSWIRSPAALLLVSATVVAVVWANSPWSGAYEALWATEGSVLLGGIGLEMDLGHWINDGLMASSSSAWRCAATSPSESSLTVAGWYYRCSLALAGWWFPLCYIC